MDSNNIDWSLLPHNPLEFFQLPEEPDKRTLKRAYNRLIKIYKPDKHPQEFMRIREAYEQLDAKLMYGRNAEPPAPPISKFQPEPTHSKKSHTPDATSKGAGNWVSRPAFQEAETLPDLSFNLCDTWRATLEAERPLEQLAAELQNAHPRSPQDFILHILLNESLNRKRDSSEFINKIVQAIKAHPTHPIVAQVLQYILRSKDCREMIEQLLAKLQWVYTPDTYFRKTENLWYKLTEIAGIEYATEYLQETFVTYDLSDAHNSAFLIRWLKKHFHLVDIDWFERHIQMLNDFAEEGLMGQYAWHELFVLNVLFAYRQNLECFLGCGELAQEMHQVIKNYFTDDPLAEPMHVIRLARKMRDLDALIATFSGEVKLAHVLYLLTIVQDETCEDVMAFCAFGTNSEGQVRLKWQELSNEWYNRSSSSLGCVVSLCKFLLVFVMPVIGGLSFSKLILGSLFESPHWLFVGGIALPIGFGLFFVISMLPMAHRFLNWEIDSKRKQRVYSDYFRPEIAALATKHGLSLQQFLNICIDENQSNTSESVALGEIVKSDNHLDFYLLGARIKA